MTYFAKNPGLYLTIGNMISSSTSPNSAIQKKLIYPSELHDLLPLSEEAIATVTISKTKISKILSGEIHGKILIIGPCSADFEDSILEYGNFLSEMREKYKNSPIEIIQRFYTGKPRTVGGWKGLAHSQPGEKSDINQGIIESRRIAIKLLSMGIPLADEMLHPQLIEHFSDIYSYLAVGARSTENQYHREVASGLNIPVGMKNPTSGDLGTMLNSIEAGQSPSTYTVGDSIIESTGNNMVHGILRGGNKQANYDPESINQLCELIKERKGKIQNPGIIIDLSHDNCKQPNGKKDPIKQLSIIDEIYSNISQYNDPNIIKGFMVESYLEEGRQDYTKDAIHGLSLTDPCIGLEKTRQLIQLIVENNNT